MDVTYGHGIFLIEGQRYQGRIILSEHKLFLQQDGIEVAQSFIPLEKIEVLRKKQKMLELEIRLSPSRQFTAEIQGEGLAINQLAGELVNRRGLKKKFLKNEWFEDEY